MAEPVAGNWSIVLIGQWNVPLFSPGWVTGRLTNAEQIDMEFPAIRPTQSFRLGFDDIHLLVEASRIVVSPQRAETAVLETMERVALKVLSDLPHTPVQAVGVNFQFRESDPDHSLLELFNFQKDAELVDAGAGIKARSLTRLLTIDDHMLKLRTDLLESGHMIIDFNFHKDVADATQATDYLAGTPATCRGKAEDLLARIFEIGIQ